MKKPKALKQSFFEQFPKMNDAIASKNCYQNEQFFEIQWKLSAAYQIRFGFTEHEKKAIR